MSGGVTYVGKSTFRPTIASLCSGSGAGVLTFQLPTIRGGVI
jgi:hypothetical protein